MNGLQIEEIRNKLGVTKSELAQKLGVTANTLGNWYSGKNMPQMASMALNYLASEQSKGVPYYEDLPVSAGERDMLIADALPSGYLSLPGVTAEAVFPVVGCSMQPEIQQGDIIGVVKIAPGEVLDPDKVYLVITSSDRMIKHLAYDPDEGGIIWCISPNYQKFKIPTEEVKHIYRVTFCGRIKPL